MKKVFKLIAMLFGVITLIVGAGSCSDDDDSNDCCTITYSYDTYTYTIEACEDGSITYNEGGDISTGNWHDDYSNWAEVKETMLEEDAKCD